MADIFDTTDQKNEWVDKYKSVKLTGERIVELIITAKATVAEVKADITASTLFTSEEKTEMEGKLTARIEEVKANILAQFGL